MDDSTRNIKEAVESEYSYGFHSQIDTDILPKGLSEDTIRTISEKKNEPEWMLQWRLKAYRRWLEMSMPHWANLKINPIDFQDIIYYAAPKKKANLKSLDEVDPELLETFKKLGISIEEQKRLSGVAIDVIMDSSSVATTFQDQLKKQGIIFCSMSEAIQEHPELVRSYLGSVVPVEDNFFAALNSAVFSDGSFCYIPEGTRCPVELSTYFRINTANSGQFERTLIVAEKGSYVSYLEGCTAPMWDEHQLHAACRRDLCQRTVRGSLRDRAELVPRRQKRQRRRLQLRYQTRPLRRIRLQDHLDTSRNRICYHMEIPKLHP